MWAAQPHTVVGCLLPCLPRCHRVPKPTPKPTPFPAPSYSYTAPHVYPPAPYTPHPDQTPPPQTMHPISPPLLLRVLALRSPPAALPPSRPTPGVQVRCRRDPAHPPPAARLRAAAARRRLDRPAGRGQGQPPGGPGARCVHDRRAAVPACTTPASADLRPRRTCPKHPSLASQVLSVQAYICCPQLYRV